MSGSRQGTVYLTNISGSPIVPTVGHKAIYTQTDGVFAIDSAGASVRLDDYGLIQDVSGALTDLISGGAIALFHGNVTVPINNSVVSITHDPVSLTSAYPVVSIKVPDNDSIVYPLSVTSRTTTGFDVLLGGAPDVGGYSIDWFMAAGGVSTSSITGGSGGGSSSLGVTFGSTTVSNVSSLTFVGAQSLVDNGGGSATLTLSGGSGGSSTSEMKIYSAGNTLVSTSASSLEFSGTAITSVVETSAGYVQVSVDATQSATSSAVVVSATGDTFFPDGNADVYDYLLTGPVTIYSPTALGNGKSLLISLTQPAGGLASLTLSPTGGLAWKMPNGTLTLSTDTGNAIDLITVTRIGSNIFATIVKNFN